MKNVIQTDIRQLPIPDTVKEFLQEEGTIESDDTNSDDSNSDDTDSESDSETE